MISVLEWITFRPSKSRNQQPFPSLVDHFSLITRITFRLTNTRNNATNKKTGETVPNLPGFGCYWPGWDYENAVWLNVPFYLSARKPWYFAGGWRWADMTGINDHHYQWETGWTPYKFYNFFIQVPQTNYCLRIQLPIDNWYAIGGARWIE